MVVKVVAKVRATLVLADSIARYGRAFTYVILTWPHNQDHV